VRIYVAGPYSAETEENMLSNVNAAIDVAIMLIQKGHDPIVPHLTHYIDRRAKARGIEIPYAWWLRYDRHLLIHCDALYYIRSSPGADYERGVADALDLPIYTAMEQVPDVVGNAA